jgi:hypothetical protein
LFIIFAGTVIQGILTALAFGATPAVRLNYSRAWHNTSFCTLLIGVETADERLIHDAVDSTSSNRAAFLEAPDREGVRGGNLA